MDEFRIQVSRDLHGSPVVVVTHIATGLVRISAFERDIDRAVQRCITSIRKRLEELGASSGTGACRRSIP